MSTLEQLYSQAEKRRVDNQLPYAGAVTPAEAFELLQLDPRTRLVDVRTRAELDWVGRPVVGDGQYAHVEWTRYPGGVPNAEFIDQLRRGDGRLHEGAGSAGRLRRRQGWPGASEDGVGLVFPRTAVDWRLTDLTQT